MEKLELDLRQLAIEKLFEKQFNVDLTEDKKQRIRANDYIEKFKDYATLTKGKQPTTTYKTKEGNTITKDEMVKAYIKEHEITEIKETKENYRITITPSQRAKDLYNKIIDLIEKEDNNETVDKRVAKIGNKMPRIN